MDGRCAGQRRPFAVLSFKQETLVHRPDGLPGRPTAGSAGPVFVKPGYRRRGVSLANTKSAIKMIRVSERRRRTNQPIRSELKTLIKTARTEIDGGHFDAAQGDVREAVSALDKAANKGAIHRNAASRRKSRLMKRLAKAEKASAS